MLDKVLDRLAGIAARYEKSLGWFAIGWFALTCAAYASFIPLPDIPYITDRNAWMLSGPWNAIWWGFLRPQILARKEALLTGETARNPGER